MPGSLLCCPPSRWQVCPKASVQARPPRESLARWRLRPRSAGALAAQKPPSWSPGRGWPDTRGSPAPSPCSPSPSPCCLPCTRPAAGGSPGASSASSGRWRRTESRRAPGPPPPPVPQPVGPGGACPAGSDRSRGGGVARRAPAGAGRPPGRGGGAASRRGRGAPCVCQDPGAQPGGQGTARRRGARGQGGGRGGAGRAALAEVRRTLGIMDAADHAAGPPFGVAGIMALAERRRAGGLPVRISVAGNDPGLPAAVDAALYRLGQGALTNVVKHAGRAATDVNIAIEPAVVRVRVGNSAPGSDAVTVGAGSGHGLAGMRERVESCQGRLWYGPQPGGGFEVQARFPLPPAGIAADGAGARRPVEQAWAPAGWAIGRLRTAGARAGAAVTLAVLCADACASADRRGPLALNIALVAGMSLALLWWRRCPLWFLLAVNLLALPVSNGLASIDNPTLVSTYVFAVPVWAVAAWSGTGAAVTGLALTAAFDAGEGMYWHLGGSSIVANVLLAGALWIAGRAVRRQRLMAADLELTRSILEAEQQALEELTLAAERSGTVTRLNSLVDEEVSAMMAAAGAVKDQISGGPAATDGAVAAIGEIEQAGRQGIARLREVVGLLRSEEDPDRLLPQPVLADLRDLI